jgi:3',5'-cyclic AMP phosphodiesterase CpdA
MVKSVSKIFLSALSLAIVCITMGCDFVDLAGLFVSHELNERLEAKNNFIYLTEDDRNMKVTPPITGDFSFIVMTDTHIENGDTKDVEKIKGEITKYDAKFVAILGDITQNGAKKDIIAATNFMRSLPVPCYPVIGNHDVYFNNWSEGWGKYIGSSRYKVSDGTYVTLFILDSANAFFGKSQVDWLERELKTAQGTVFVMTHSDLFVQDKIKIQQLYDPAERARIMSILHDNNDRCKMMLMGHSHERVEKEFGEVKYISTEDYKDFQVYMLVKVKDGVVSREFHSLK